MVRRLGFRPLVLVFGLSVAFCGARRLLALIYYAPRKIGIWRGKEGSTVQRFNGSTVQRIGFRSIVQVFGLPLVVLQCKTIAGLPIFRFAKNRKLVPERGIDGSTPRRSDVSACDHLYWSLGCLS